MPESRGKQVKNTKKKKKSSSADHDDLVGSLTEKLKKLGDVDEIDDEIGDSFGVLTEEEVEMFLMDALWVNERLHDYTATVEGRGEMGCNSDVMDIEWSDEEEGACFEEKIPVLSKPSAESSSLPPLNTHSKPTTRKAWDHPVLSTEVLSDHQMGSNHQISREIRQT